MTSPPSPPGSPPAFRSRSSPVPRQSSFDELGTPLRGVEFVVVDLETTGGGPATCDITEIGAVRVRGGDVVGEFQTLVRPSAAIPPFIAVLTGITDAMVASAPGPASALPAFLEFARGSVLVAHNAPFDVGFLRAGARRLALAWPGFAVVDTARLARRALTREEAPNCKLATLARLFRTETEPCHRALADARATVGVLHGLLERVGGLGVQSLEELLAYSHRVPDAVRRKRHLADDLPRGPGVYVFRDGSGLPLYVGKATDLRIRVRSYFTAAETRRRMAEMVVVAERVDAVPCATLLEAEVRELRAIRELQPRYNRRSRASRGETWLRLTDEGFPRLSLTRVAGGAECLGPFTSRRAAETVLAALHDVVPIRRCTARIPVRRPPTGSACVLAELGRCGAPCDGRETAADYAGHVDRLRRALAADPGEVVDGLSRRLDRLVAGQRYEEAAAQRDRIAAVVRATARRQRVAALVAVPELAAARPRDGGWEIALLRAGRLAATTVAPRGFDPRASLRAARATADSGVGATTEETEICLRWLELPGTRLVELDGAWCSPARGAARFRRWLAEPASGRPLEDRRGLRPVGPP